MERLTLAHRNCERLLVHVLNQRNEDWHGEDVLRANRLSLSSVLWIQRHAMTTFMRRCTSCIISFTHLCLLAPLRVMMRVTTSLTWIGTTRSRLVGCYSSCHEFLLQSFLVWHVNLKYDIKTLMQCWNLVSWHMAISERQPLAMIIACQVVETLPNIMSDLLIVSPTDD
jgi:hypothetical protein